MGTSAEKGALFFEGLDFGDAVVFGDFAGVFDDVLGYGADVCC